MKSERAEHAPFARDGGHAGLHRAGRGLVHEHTAAVARAAAAQSQPAACVV